MVANQMGVEMSDADIHNMMQDLDTNRDGIISLMEFI
jgi:Ca2+-binding EF-hand superfamily protein